MPENMSPISLYAKEEGKMLSLNMDLSEIESVLGSPEGEPEVYDGITVFTYGDVVNRGRIFAGFKEDKACLIVLTQLSGKNFYTDLGMTTGTSDEEFWKMYGVPDHMSYQDSGDARNSYTFAIREENGAYTVAIVEDAGIEGSNSSANYYMQVNIGYKNFNNNIDGLLIGTPEAIQSYRAK